MHVDEKLGPSRSAGREVLAFLGGPCTFFESTFRPRKTCPVRRFCHAILHFHCPFWCMFSKDCFAKSPVGTAKSGVGTGHRRFPLIKSTCGWKNTFFARAQSSHDHIFTHSSHAHSTGHTHTTHETMPKNLFDMLGDDLLSDVMALMPLRTRVVFAICVCKSLRNVANALNVFKKLKLYPNKQYDPWTFLKDGNVDMSVQELDIHEYRGMRVSIPPMQHLTKLKKLVIRDVSVDTLKVLCKRLPLDSLTHLSVCAGTASKKLITLLEKANSLETFQTSSGCISRVLPGIAYKWIMHRNGNHPHPLRCIGCQIFCMTWLGLFDLEDLHCNYLDEDISGLTLPFVKNVFFYHIFFNSSDGVKKARIVIKACPQLEKVRIQVWNWQDHISEAAKSAVELLKVEFPKVEFGFFSVLAD